MSVQITQHSPQLVSVKNTSRLVPYSRDYVTRLARSGRVIGVQIDREWFVEKTSLVNFYEQSLIEDSVRSRRLSESRKVELEARDVYLLRVARLHAAGTGRRRRTLMQTALILLFGFGTGALLLLSGQVASQNQYSFAAAVSEAVLPGSVKAVTEGVSESAWLNQSVVSESVEQLSLRGGIVVLPAAATSSDVATDFFSDPVTVEMVSTTTGVIRNGRDTLPFVRVPDDVQADIVPAGGSE